ncbi:CbiX/SirB N-terminal domain-containing protein [Isoptericola sp. b515]|uniref:sirohydrochlorin chelatase n=1 Tax=Isoptericola sp. b515 TaxID=3064652 RepID=UPI0027125F5D|nr:CbiX/SirB N-terminal domain-containing protein [Isoptericola sp. b515]MDO8146958.1 CbiX/SirB N-terminal domain-containing protein [Isoptericola sp. b515]
MTVPTLLAISHGTSSATGAAAVAGLVDAVTDRLAGTVPVRAGFVDVQEPDVPTCLAALRETSTVLVPLLLSAGFHVHVDLCEDVEGAVSAGQQVALAGALGPDDRLVDLLERRLADAGLAAGDVVVLAAAGSSDARAVADCERTGELLAARTGHPVRVGYLANATPTLRDVVAAVREEHPGARVATASYLIAPGYFQTLAERAGGDTTSAPLLLPEGPAPEELVEIVVDRYRAAR